MYVLFLSRSATYAGKSTAEHNSSTQPGTLHRYPPNTWEKLAQDTVTLDMRQPEDASGTVRTHIQEFISPGGTIHQLPWRGSILMRIIQPNMSTLLGASSHEAGKTKTYRHITQSSKTTDNNHFSWNLSCSTKPDSRGLRASVTKQILAY